MAEEDERLFLDFLRSVSDIAILESAAPSPQLLTVEQFSPREQGHWQYFIWNRAFAWSPSYGQVIPTAAQRAGWYYHTNIHEAPVLEYDRHSFASTGGVGRVYWAARGHVYSVQAFSKWYQQVVNWIRKHGTQLIRGRHNTYFLPAALRVVAR